MLRVLAGLSGLAEIDLPGHRVLLANVLIKTEPLALMSVVIRRSSQKDA